MRLGLLLLFLITAAPAWSASEAVVISQIYGGGGNAGAAFKNDFIELFNRGGLPVDLSGWSVQYAAAGGGSWRVTELTGTLVPGGRYLVQEAAGAGGTVDLPRPDAIGGIALSAAAGKVALVRASTPIAAGTVCPVEAGAPGLVDFVGYGPGATCFEGAGPAPGPGNARAVVRVGRGCVETDSNGDDFALGDPVPRNTADSPESCDAVPLASIHDVQGNGTRSPLASRRVAVEGVVTALRGNAFFLQAPEVEWDADPGTSEGLVVFTGGPPPVSAAVGRRVRVVGEAREFASAGDPAGPGVTELVEPSVVPLSGGHPLPPPVVLTMEDIRPSGPADWLERYEGMRVTVPSLTVVAPTLGVVDEVSASAEGNGVFYGVLTGTPRPLRGPGVLEGVPLPAGAPDRVPRFDGNPERLRVDSDSQPGAMSLDVAAGAVINGLTGPLDFAFQTYTVLPDPWPRPSVVDRAAASPVVPPGPDEFAVAAFNLERFFDTEDDPAIREPILTAAAFERRLGKASLAVRRILMSPDILAVVEVENLAALRALADRINRDAVADGGADPGYAAHLEEGNDVGGIDSGFLVKASRVTVREVVQAGKDATYVNPLSGAAETLNDRPPLLLRAVMSGGPAVTVIVNHLRSLSGVEDAEDGARVRAKRRAQAEFLADLIQARQRADPVERILAVGDFNAFEFSDGYVDTLGIVRGRPAPAEEIVLASADRVDPDLVNLVELLPPDRRYSYVFDGNAQALDHALANAALMLRFRRIEYARLGADFPESYRNDPGRPERLSDHDALVATFSSAPPAPAVEDVTIKEGNRGLTPVVFTVRLSEPAETAAQIRYATAGGSACAFADYIPRRGVLRFPPGADRAAVKVYVRGDRRREKDEVFFLRLMGAVPLRARATILNDDR